MPEGILGRKLGMTQVFEADGRLTPVTVIEAGPCWVVQRKTVQNDGYEAVQLAFGEVAERKANKPLRGHYARSGAKIGRKLQEFRVDDSERFQALSEGDEVKADLFSGGDLVDVTGVSKGKGFAGPIKRWNFGRGPMTHGSRYHRGVGSLGNADSSRVFKGRKMAGRMGSEKRTIQRLRVVEVDADKNLILVAGSVPGPKGSMLTIRKSVKVKA